MPDLDEPQHHHRRDFMTDEEEEAGERFRYPEDPDAPPDAVGPHAAVETEMTIEDLSNDPGAGAAAAAVLAAHKSGLHGSAAMMDVLEAAETAFESMAAAETAEAARQLGSPRGLGSAAPAPPALGVGGSQPPDTPRKAAIAESTRERMIQSVFEALQANPRYGSEPARNLMHHAQAVEDALFTSSHSKQVYLSKVSNAVRLARTVPDVSDIPRIASGEPKAVAEGHTAGDSSPYVLGAGYTGYVVKPQE